MRYGAYFERGPPAKWLINKHCQNKNPDYEEVNGWFDSRGFGRNLEKGTLPHGMRSDQSVTKAGLRFLSARL